MNKELRNLIVGLVVMVLGAGSILWLSQRSPAAEGDQTLHYVLVVIALGALIGVGLAPSLLKLAADKLGIAKSTNEAPTKSSGSGGFVRPQLLAGLLFGSAVLMIIVSASGCSHLTPQEKDDLVRPAIRCGVVVASSATPVVLGCALDPDNYSECVEVGMRAAMESAYPQCLDAAGEIIATLLEQWTPERAAMQALCVAPGLPADGGDPAPLAPTE